jgi:hypothetical protein
VCTACGSIESLSHAHVLVASERAPRVIGKGEIEVTVHGRCDACG